MEPPPDEVAFSDAVFRAEGLDPQGDRRLYRQVREVVAMAFRVADERETQERMLEEHDR